MSDEFQFKTEAEFFNAVGDHWLHPKNCGEAFYPVTIEELYQHFKARMASEEEEAPAVTRPAILLGAALERLEAEYGENIPVNLAYAEGLKAIREARRQAYEDAAQKLDERKQGAERERRALEDGSSDEMYWRADGKEDAFEDAAHVVRALADSISREGEK